GTMNNCILMEGFWTLTSATSVALRPNWGQLRKTEEFAMRIFIAILLLLLLLPITNAQEKEKWKRVITFDESVVDLNVSQVSFGEGDIARVKFRTTFSKLVPIRGGGNYKVLIEEMDFRCQERLYRLAEET